jgi:hypothetical protein
MKTMSSRWTEPLVLRLVQRHGSKAPEAILETFAEKQLAISGQDEFPVDVEGVASLLGIRRRIGDHPFAGRIYAEANGQLVMDLNASDSEPRRRFSCAHEIMHTAFPGFRKESRYRADPVVETYNRARGEEEYLCDVGAAALIMPRSLVQGSYSIDDGLKALEQLALDAGVSLEAAGNRLAALSEEPAVFLVLQFGNKPADLPAMRRGEQIEQRLRLRYAVVQGMNLYLPKYKSADDDSPFVRALTSGRVECEVAPLPGGPPSLLFSVEAKAYPRQGPEGEIKRVLAVAQPSGRS